MYDHVPSPRSYCRYTGCCNLSSFSATIGEGLGDHPVKAALINPDWITAHASQLAVLFRIWRGSVNSSVASTMKCRNPGAKKTSKIRQSNVDETLALWHRSTSTGPILSYRHNFFVQAAQRLISMISFQEDVLLKQILYFLTRFFQFSGINKFHQPYLTTPRKLTLNNILQQTW